MKGAKGKVGHKGEKKVTPIKTVLTKKAKGKAKSIVKQGEEKSKGDKVEATGSKDEERTEIQI